MNRQQLLLFFKCCFIFLYIWNLVVKLATLYCVYSKEKWDPSKETLKFSPCSVESFAFFANFTRHWRSCCSSGLNVAWVGDSQTDEGRYIYRINDALHRPHNSCLLHLANWDWRPIPICRAPWLNSWAALCVFLLSSGLKSTLTLPCKNKHLFKLTVCCGTACEKSAFFVVQCFTFNVVHPSYQHVCFQGGSGWCVGEIEQGSSQQ